jgi:hypothetical protein
MRFFPKTILLVKKNVYGQWDSKTNTIELNTVEIKNDHPKAWRRIATETWLHECSHAVFFKIKPYSLRFENIDLIAMFKDELIAQTISWIAEIVLFLPHQFDSIDEGAVTSLSCVIREIKQRNNYA